MNSWEYHELAKFLIAVSSDFVQAARVIKVEEINGESFLKFGKHQLREYFDSKSLNLFVVFAWFTLFSSKFSGFHEHLIKFSKGVTSNSNKTVRYNPTQASQVSAFPAAVPKGKSVDLFASQTSSVELPTHPTLEEFFSTSSTDSLEPLKPTTKRRKVVAPVDTDEEDSDSGSDSGSEEESDGSDGSGSSDGSESEEEERVEEVALTQQQKTKQTQKKPPKAQPSASKEPAKELPAAKSAKAKSAQAAKEEEAREVKVEAVGAAEALKATHAALKAAYTKGFATIWSSGEADWLQDAGVAVVKSLKGLTFSSKRSVSAALDLSMVAMYCIIDEDAKRPTLKVLRTLVAGGWLLQPSFLTSSGESGQWAAPEEHEHPAFPLRATRAKGAKSPLMVGRLLQGMRVHLPDERAPPLMTRRNAEELVSFLGGEVTTEQRAELVLFQTAAACKKAKAPMVCGLMWLVNSIMAWKKLPYEEYREGQRLGTPESQTW